MRSLRILLLVVLLAALAPFAVVGWQDLWSEILENKGPVIRVIEEPRGFGLAPVSLVVELEDADSGLDEVIVRTIQRNRENIILRERLSGEKSKRVTISFDPKQRSLTRGSVGIQIRAFDRSFWSNRSELSRVYKVDYKEPKLEVVSRQHNARLGGSQMIFYRVFDENLSFSGVKVGKQAFAGYPARIIDPGFESSDLFVALYAIPIDSDPKKTRVRLFAEDTVGNASSENFYNKILPRKVPVSSIKLSQSYLRNQVHRLFEKNRQEIERFYHDRGGALSFTTERDTDDRLLEKFIILEEDLRQLNELAILSELSTSRHDWYWDQVFEPPLGTVYESFGQKLDYSYQGQPLGSRFTDGYVFGQLRGMGSEVVASADGVVIFAKDMGVLGKAIAIDHGLGVSTIYGYLGLTLVKAGQKVERGEVIGETGNSGLGRRSGFLFQVRVNGHTTDPREWWDRRWFIAHVAGKIQEVKKIVGAPTR